ncbi:MAG: DegT/DnrJ/EryC1/StrS family aminotransferase [Holosporales bacterium]|jgi:dTDP-4-amino-4,6-dideoxygalactose transaminase|nr:DegT/DnrJ/EryC1/StrS family aminotransferase [Holosporales bacterium]
MIKCIRLSSPWFGDEEIEAAAIVLRSQKVSMGNEVKQFEIELSEFFQNYNVTCVSSCTAALQLALQAFEIGAGDEVLVPTFTFVATFQAISATGAKPIPCDIDLDDAFIDVDDADSKITSKTKAIVPVPFAGCDRKMWKVQELAQRNGLSVIVDAAHCFGHEDLSPSDIVWCFSFDAIKNVSCIDGGAIVTTNQKITDKVKDVRLLGVIDDTDKRFHGKRSWDFDVTEQGWRYHMNDLCAAVGRAQLAKFPVIRERRRNNARIYMEHLRNIPNIQLFPIDVERTVPHIFPIIIKDGLRNVLQKSLMESGIETGVQYKPNHLLTYYRPPYNLPKAMQLYESILSIPVHPMLTEEDVMFIVDNIKHLATV